MDGPTGYEVWYSESKNPKDGELLYTGEVPALSSGECFTIPLEGEKTGNYKVKVYQREGHPGTGELWSETCAFVQEEEEQEEEEEEKEEEKEEEEEIVVPPPSSTEEQSTQEPIPVHTPEDTFGPGFSNIFIVLGVITFVIGYYFLRKGIRKN
jgi:TasA anchoring/assembly protein